MTIVLVHGNPETDAIWDDMRSLLHAERVVALSPPGFGAPVPEGFSATSDEYVDWLAAELTHFDAPVDLVGHDWGGGHVARVAAQHPELVRSWTTDIAGCFDPEYVWHERAQVWQTPGAGEQAIQQQLAAPAALRATFYQGLGMSPGAAESASAAFTDEMGRCILALYRSAAQPHMAEWGAETAGLRARPGHVLIPTDDHFTGGEQLARRTADRLGARVTVLEGLGHWWMCQDPRRGADAINSFVESLTSPSGNDDARQPGGR